MYLFEVALATGTVAHCRSAIAAVHDGFPDGSSVSDSRALSQLLKGRFVSRPPVRRLVPAWDLFSVLATLTGPPFEPLAKATLLHLTIKVAFLLAV